MTRWVRGFAAFWYDFIVGEDWRAAVVVVIVLAATAALTAAGVDAWWLLPAGALIALGWSLRRAVAGRT